MNTVTPAQIDWISLERDTPHGELPIGTQKIFGSLRLQAQILEAALDNYAHFSSLDSPHQSTVQSALPRLAAARSIAYEAAIFLKIAKALKGEVADCAVPIATYERRHPDILNVRDSFAHLYERIQSGDPSQEQKLSSIEGGCLIARSQVGRSENRLLLTYDLAFDAEILVRELHCALVK